MVCDVLRDAAEVHALTYAPDPATHSRCTLGGMIGNNSCGPHSVMSGKTEENIEELEVLTYDGARFWVGPTGEEELERIIRAGGRKGEIYAALKALRDRYADEIRARFPDIKRRVSGYNLNQLLPENGFNVARALVGTEGTCALTLRARDQPRPQPAGPRGAGARLPRHLPRRRRRADRSCRTGRSPWKGSTSASSAACARATGSPTTWRCCRPAGPGSWSSSAPARASRRRPTRAR